MFRASRTLESRQGIEQTPQGPAQQVFPGGQGVRHRIENPGAEPMIFIEVQTGSYFGEDDIVRLDDDYGRA